MFLFLTAAFRLLLMVAYKYAETLNKIMYSVTVTILFAIIKRQCHNA